MPSRLLYRYLIVGAAAYVIEMAALLFLRRGLDLSPLGSVAVSFWIGFAAAFVLQKLVAFQNFDRRAAELSRQLAGYGLLVAWNYGFTLLAVHLLTKNVSVFIVRTGVVLLVTSWNFIIYRVIFRVEHVE